MFYHCQSKVFNFTIYSMSVYQNHKNDLKCKHC